MKEVQKIVIIFIYEGSGYKIIKGKKKKKKIEYVEDLNKVT